MTAVRQGQVTLDCADPGAPAAFWAEVLGYRLDSPPPGFATWDDALDAWGVPEEHRNDRSAVSDAGGAGPRLFFQKVPEPKVAKNRLHLDVRAARGAGRRACRAARGRSDRGRTHRDARSGGERVLPRLRRCR